MPTLKPSVVRRAASSLFGCGHGESLVFFTLKASGCNTTDWIRVTSSNVAPPGLKLIAQQPEGFDQCVAANLSRFAARNTNGLPTKPGSRGSADNYTMFWPVSEEAQYLLRKDDCNRQAVYSNLMGGRNALNSDRASMDQIYELRDPEEGNGKMVRFVPRYEFYAHWYYGPEKGEPMRISLPALAVWMHRSTELDEDTTIDALVQKTIATLHLTDAECFLIFPRELSEKQPFKLTSNDFTSQWNIEKYFAALCLPNESIAVLPQPSLEPPVEKERWERVSHILGFSKDRESMSPLDLAKEALSTEVNILLYGPPRTGKSTVAELIAAEYLGLPREQLRECEGYTRVQFHQSWTYGDFVRKLSPKLGGDSLSFQRQNGVFLEHCDRNSDTKSVFVIEELNRANLASVFGEVFQVLEKDYRGTEILLPGSVDGEQGTKIRIPKELLVIATANDVDRSTLPLDYAMLSRFCTITCPVDHRISYQILVDKGWSEKDAEKLVEAIQQIEADTGFPVGHAYFYLLRDKQSLMFWYTSRLRPALKLFVSSQNRTRLTSADSLIEEVSTK